MKDMALPHCKLSTDKSSLLSRCTRLALGAVLSRWQTGSDLTPSSSVATSAKDVATACQTCYPLESCSRNLTSSFSARSMVTETISNLVCFIHKRSPFKQRTHNGQSNDISSSHQTDSKFLARQLYTGIKHTNLYQKPRNFHPGLHGILMYSHVLVLDWCVHPQFMSI